MHILLAQFYSSQPTPDYDKIAVEMRARGHTVWVGTPNAVGDVDWHDGQRIVANLPGYGRSRLPRKLANRLAKIAMFRRVHRFVAQTRPDIVQLNAFELFRLLPLGAPRETHYILDVRQVNEQHGTGPIGRARAALANNARGFYSRHLFKRTTFLHPAGARRVLGDEWTRWASIVPMGVDRQFLAVERPPIEADRRGPVVFIYIGRLTQRRRLERILDAAALVRRETGNFRVIFLGYDASDGAYAERIRQLGLGGVVSIRPPIAYEQVPAAVAATDVALAYVPERPADWMYHPTLKILEYRALGMPIIATDFLPNRELIEDGANGLLVQNTAESIASAMLRYICDPSFLAHSRAAALARRQGQTWEAIATHYLTLYEGLRAGRGQEAAGMAR